MIGLRIHKICLTHQMVSQTFNQLIYDFSNKIFSVMFFLEVEFSIEIKIWKKAVISLYPNKKDTLKPFKIRENKIRRFIVFP